MEWPPIVGIGGFLVEINGFGGFDYIPVLFHIYSDCSLFFTFISYFMKRNMKSFKDKLVLDGINLCIEQGKIYGFIGRNGAGKTALMSVMTAQTPADSGEVTYDGEAVW